jgi:predicted anti-sigma-YlaC factor YlaD
MPLLSKLLRMLALTKERELTCSEVNELLDYYLELEQSGENVKALMPTMTQHLRICPECVEEYEALRQIIGKEPEVSAPSA